MNFRLSHTSSLLLLFVAVACAQIASCSPNDYPTPEVEWSEAMATCTASDLWEWADSGTPLPDNTVVVGRVTANDLSGNFYQLVTVEDSTGALTIRLALSGLAGHYPVGCKVAVEASGLIVGLYNGTLSVGRSRNIWSDYRVEPLVGREEIFSRLRVCDSPHPLLPTNATTQELTANRCGSLIRIEGLQHNSDEAENNYWGVTPYGSEADRYFTSPSGDVVVIRTSIYADFASATIPQGELSICGILYADRYRGEDVWVLKMRDLDDVRSN